MLGLKVYTITGQQYNYLKEHFLFICMSVSGYVHMECGYSRRPEGCQLQVELELESQVVVNSLMWGAEDWIQVLVTTGPSL